MAFNANGLGTRGVAPGAKVGDPTEGVGAWTVAMETEAIARSFALVTLTVANGGKEKRRETGKGGSDEKKNLQRKTARCTRQNERRAK